jgi:hypothetical protein
LNDRGEDFAFVLSPSAALSSDVFYFFIGELGATAVEAIAIPVTIAIAIAIAVTITDDDGVRALLWFVVISRALVILPVGTATKGGHGRQSG